MNFIYLFFILSFFVGFIKCNLPATKIDIENEAKKVLPEDTTSLIAKINWMSLEIERLNQHINNISERMDQQENFMKNCSKERLNKTVHKMLQYPPLKLFVDLLKYKKSTEDINKMLPNQPLKRMGNWVVILRRQDGSENFNRTWLDYKNGFGNPKQEFFIGLDTLYAINNNDKPQEVLIVLQDFDNNTAYVKYDDFIIGNEEEKYQLKKVGNYSGNAFDALSIHLNENFEDGIMPGSCTESFVGAWWHRKCQDWFLTGTYHHKPLSNEQGLNFVEGLYWDNWNGVHHSIKIAEMMVRPKA